MDRALSAGLTSRQSIRLGSLSPSAGAFFNVLALLLFRSSSTRISLELTMEGGGESGRAGGGDRVVVGGGVGGSGRSRRRGMGGFLSLCCWQPFRISFRLGELSRLKERERDICTLSHKNNSLFLWQTCS